MTRPDFSLERQFQGIVAGVDEAGCGPWAGPVVAAAAILDIKILPENLLCRINDSKKITKKNREDIFQHIQSLSGKGICFGIGIASVSEIDQLNIGNATCLAMKRAVEQLEIFPQALLIDGIRNPKLPYPTEMVKKGDSRSLSIATASIIAKVTRDAVMEQLDRDFPSYGWAKNAGYGTAQHQKAIFQEGITCYHRRSFAPIAKHLLTTSQII